MVIDAQAAPNLGFRIPDVYTSYRFYVNGTLISSNGIPDCDQENSLPKWSTELRDLPRNTDTLMLVLHVSNYDHSKAGVRESITLGLKNELEWERDQEFATTLFLTGALVMGGLFFIDLYLFERKDTSILYFSLFCLVYSYRIIGADFYFLHQLIPSIPYWAAIRMEYFSLTAGLALFGMFVWRLFPKESNDYLAKGLVSVSAGYALLSIVTPPFIFTSLFEYYLAFLTVFIFYGLYIYIQAARNRREGANFALWSGVLMIVAFTLKIVNYLSFVLNITWLLLGCYVGFFFLQSLILSYRYTLQILRAYKEANAAAATKANFLATVSHEIRTPLNGVLGMAELLGQTELKEDQQKYLSIIQKSGGFLLDILNDILDFSRNESEAFQLELKPVALDVLMEEAALIFYSRATEKALGFDVHYKNSNDLVLLDPLRLKQVLSNLLNNAIKFTSDGRVDLYANVLSENAEELTVEFRVVDTGIGIPENKLEQLFQPFNQADSSISRKYGGSGLGLAISRQLVDKMGGELTVESKEGEGSCFTVTMTFQKPTDKPLVTVVKEDGKLVMPKKREVMRRDFRVYVAEDNEVNQLLARKVIEGLGINVEVVPNGKALIDAFEKNDIDLILMDVQMPIMDGVTATETLIERFAHRSKPVIIAMTANVLPEDREKYEQVGMDDYISKPFTQAEVKQKINKWFNLIY